MKTLSVMIVDDDMASRDLLASLLRTQFKVDIVSVAESVVAMRKFREERYDIIWMDYDMPDLDGLEAVKIIKSVLPEQFIAMVSAHSDIETVKNAISLGVAGYLVKPFTMGKVKDIVNKYLQSSAS